MMTAQESPKPNWRKVWLSAIGGAAIGFLAMTALIELVEPAALASLGASRIAAAGTGAIYLLMALIVLAGLVNPAFGARYLNVEDADELREQRRLLVLSGMAMVALGFALGALALAHPAGAIPPLAALVAAVLLIGLATWLGLLQMRDMDEMMRNISRESTVLAFYLLSLIGGGWAMLAHLGFAAAPAPLDWLTMICGFALLATFIVVGRRRMMLPR